MIGYCDYDVCGDCNTTVTVTVTVEGYCCHLLAIWVMHTGAKSGGELVTLLSDRRLLLPSVSYMGNAYRCQIMG